jgi:sn-glycerol 3-phosphate transport system substrate-binding protein
MPMKRRTLIASAAATATATLPAAARAAAPVTLNFWHAMSGQLGDVLTGIVNAFNASQSAYTVQAAYKGAYPDTMTATIAAYRAGNAPHIAQIFDVGTATMLSAGPAVLDTYKLAPFNSSTVVMWINQDAFEKAGLDPTKPPATWPEVIAAARAIKEKDAAPIPMMTSWPTWTHFEQFAAIHSVEYATLNDGYAGNDPKLNIDAPPFAANLQRLLDAEKDGIFKYIGRDGAPSPTFYAGQAGITFDSSGIRGQLKKTATFKYAAAPLPYDPKIVAAPHNSIIGGAALYALTAPHRTADEYKGVATFFAYLGSAAVDSGWSKATGYVPVTQAGLSAIKASGFYDQNPGADVAINQLNRPNGTVYTKGIRLKGMPQIRVIIEAAWEGAIQSGAEATDVLAEAKVKGNAVIASFART